MTSISTTTSSMAIAAADRNEQACQVSLSKSVHYSQPATPQDRSSSYSILAPVTCATLANLGAEHCTLVQVVYQPKPATSCDTISWHQPNQLLTSATSTDPTCTMHASQHTHPLRPDRHHNTSTCIMTPQQLQTCCPTTRRHAPLLPPQRLDGVGQARASHVELHDAQVGDER
jgi:hypothetical protein